MYILLRTNRRKGMQTKTLIGLVQSIDVRFAIK